MLAEPKQYSYVRVHPNPDLGTPQVSAYGGENILTIPLYEVTPNLGYGTSIKTVPLFTLTPMLGYGIGGVRTVPLWVESFVLGYGLKIKM